MTSTFEDGTYQVIIEASEVVDPETGPSPAHNYLTRFENGECRGD